MVEGILRCAVENKPNSPWVSEMLLSKTCDVDRYDSLMSSHKNTVFPCQGQQHMMGEHMLEWIEQCKTCDTENGIIAYLHTICSIPDRFKLF